MMRLQRKRTLILSLVSKLLDYPYLIFWHLMNFHEKSYHLISHPKTFIQYIIG